MAKHTPGPWRVRDHREERTLGLWVDAPSHIEHYALGRPIYRQILMDDDYTEKLADAHLIASAPDLLLALRDVVIDLFYHIEMKHGAQKASEYPSIIAARAAIARANGEPSELNGIRECGE